MRECAKPLHQRRGIDPVAMHESLALTHKACMEQFCQRIPYVSAKGMEFGAKFLKETRPDARTRVESMDLNKLFDNSLLKEVQQELGGGS